MDCIDKNMTVPLRICASLLMLWSMTSAAERAPESMWMAQSRLSLMQALQDTHPSIERWEVEALLSDQQLQQLSAAALTKVEVNRLGARSGLRVTLRSQEGKTLQLPLWYAVRGYATVVAAARDIASLESLAPMDGQLAERDVMGLGCEPVLNTDQLAGMRSKRRIRARQSICAGNVESRPAVIRGEAVTVKYLGEKIQLTTSGIAQRDGRIGQRTPVKNRRTRELFIATVSANSEVTIHE